MELWQNNCQEFGAVCVDLYGGEWAHIEWIPNYFRLWALLINMASNTGCFGGGKSCFSLCTVYPSQLMSSSLNWNRVSFSFVNVKAAAAARNRAWSGFWAFSLSLLLDVSWRKFSLSTAIIVVCWRGRATRASHHGRHVIFLYDYTALL